MARAKFDFVVEAVHYAPDGQIDWVRGFERRGPAFSDRIILGRQDLISRLKGGKRIMTGRRVPQMAGTFEVGSPVQIEQLNGEEYVISGERSGKGDHLQGVPRI
jgi:hypothetical protein